MTPNEDIWLPKPASLPASQATWQQQVYPLAYLARLDNIDKIEKKNPIDGGFGAQIQLVATVESSRVVDESLFI